MKNLTSYTESLSIPRKQDLDALGEAKQNKITVNGIVQGDGNGNLSATELTEVETIELDAAAVGLGNVDNVKQYSASNPPPYPVTSVNTKTGAVTLTASDVSALPAPASATVGQIVKVKAVDAAGKITETEAVDMPSGGGEDAWEKIADVAFTADTPVYEVANFGVYRKVKVLMSRAAYVSGLNKNVWFRIRTANTSVGYAALYIGIEYGYVAWEVTGEIGETFAWAKKCTTNNRVAAQEEMKTVDILSPANPSEYGFYIDFTDTSVIQDGDTVAVYGVKR